MSIAQRLSKFFQQNALACNCLAYSSFSASAELIQQRFQNKAAGSKKAGLLATETILFSSVKVVNLPGRQISRGVLTHTVFFCSFQ